LEIKDDEEHVRLNETTLFVNVDRLLRMDGLIMYMSLKKNKERNFGKSEECFRFYSFDD
jgi:hypothetical protein